MAYKAQCTSFENFNLQGTFDCETGIAEISITPDTPLGPIILGWLYPSGTAPSPELPSDSPVWFGAADSPGTYVFSAITMNPLTFVTTLHCYQVVLGDCPDESDFSVTSADCEDPTGAICITGSEWNNDFECAGTNSTSGCVSGLLEGDYYCGQIVETATGVVYNNVVVNVPGSSLNVSFTEIPYPNYGSCDGASVTATVSGGSGSYSYDWELPTWLTGGVFTNELSIEGGYGYIELTVTDLVTGCEINTSYAFLGTNCPGYDLVGSAGPAVVNVADLLEFMAWFGTTSGGCADFDGNGVVNISDLILFMAAFGTSC